MSRRSAIRELPELHTFRPRHDPKSEGNRSEQLLPMLREVVAKVRRDKPVTFYSMRQVTAFSGAPMKAVARVFRLLQAEGLLTCVRGSRTLVTGRKRQPQRPIRGVVGMPVLLPAFIASVTWQSFFTTMEEELRKHDFVADFVFFKSGEDVSPVFTERLLRHQLDVLFWFVPPLKAKHVIDQIRDAGIRIVILGNPDPAFPSTQYELSPTQTADTVVMREWSRSGLREVRLWIAPTETNLWAAQLVSYEGKAAAQGLRWHVERLDADDVPQRVTTLSCHPPVGIIFQNTDWFCALWQTQPTAMRELCTKQRVLLAAHPPGAPIPAAAGVSVEVTVSFFADIAKRVAADIASAQAWSLSAPVALRQGAVKRISLG